MQRGFVRARFYRAEMGGSHLQYHSAEGRSGAVSEATGITFPACSLGIISNSTRLSSDASARCASAWAYGSKEEIIYHNAVGTVKTVPLQRRRTIFALTGEQLSPPCVASGAATG